MGLETLDVVIGVIFVFLLVSIIAAAVREGIEAHMKTRGAYLWLGIRELLHDRQSTGLAKVFYQHPLIYSLFPGELRERKQVDAPRVWASGRGMPSYIPARNFALALMDIAARGPVTSTATADATAPAITLENLRANILNVQSPAVRRILLTAIDSAEGDVRKAQAEIEAWYDSAMDRVSGWYKRTTHVWLLGIGFFIAVVLNVNILTIAHHLYVTPAARELVVSRAEAAVADPKYLDETNRVAAQKTLEGLSLPIGWKGYELFGRADYNFSMIWKFVAVPLGGWMLTALATSLGAPFWFDVLNKVMVIRATVKPHEKSPEEASEDRQTKPGALATTAQQRQTNVPPPPPPPPELAAGAGDPLSDVDACGPREFEETSDDDLPAATGGVQ
ncbi:MAG TPA: hypothetical protein VGF48_10590 [Thermoanaerobaculia bacterium]|jgi:hypothetical protein